MHFNFRFNEARVLAEHLNTWHFFLIVLVAFAWVKINQRRFHDSCSPFNLLFFGWVGPLLLSTMTLSSLESPWSFTVWISIGWTTAILTICSYVRRVHHDPSEPASRLAWNTGVLATLKNRKVQRLILISFALSFLAYIYNEFVRSPVGVPLFTLYSDPTMVGPAFHEWGISRESRSWALYLSVPLYLQSALVYMIGRLKPRGAGRWWIAMSVLYPFMAILKLNRTNLITTLVVLVVAEHYLDKFSRTDNQRLHPRQFVRRYPYLCASLLAVIATMFLASQFVQLRNGFDSSDAFQAVVGTDIRVYKPIDGFLSEVYEYFALPWQNFADTFQQYKPEFRLGVGFFRPVFSLLGGGQAVDETLDRIGFDPSLGPANTYPFITLIYMELGILGLIVCPLLYGLFVNWIYARFRREPNFLNFCFYLHMPIAWMWLFSSSAFIGLHFYLTMAYLWSVDRYYRNYCPQRRPDPIALAPNRPLQQMSGGT
jgi:oligosaccharide repeat unit polymerase